MANTKPVVSSIRLPSLYTNKPPTGTTQTEFINFNLTAAKIEDPYSLFKQFDNKFNVCIPLSRRYQIKCTIDYTASSSTNLADIKNDPYAVGKLFQTGLEKIKIYRQPYNSTPTELNLTGPVIQQDGFAGLTLIVTGLSFTQPPSITSYEGRPTLIPAIAEGFIYLYAGDILTVEHSYNVFKRPKLVISSTFGTYITLVDDFRVSAGFYFEIAEADD